MAADTFQEMYGTKDQDFINWVVENKLDNIVSLTFNRIKAKAGKDKMVERWEAEWKKETHKEVFGASGRQGTSQKKRKLDTELYTSRGDPYNELTEEDNELMVQQLGAPVVD